MLDLAAWHGLAELQGSDQMIDVAAFGLSVPVADIYRGVIQGA